MHAKDCYCVAAYKPWMLQLNLFMTVVHFVLKFASVVMFNVLKLCCLLRSPCKKTAAVMNAVI